MVTSHAVPSTYILSVSLGLTDWADRSLRPWDIVGRAPKSKRMGRLCY